MAMITRQVGMGHRMGRYSMNRAMVGSLAFDMLLPPPTPATLILLR